jgi:hypothetical protein
MKNFKSAFFLVLLFSVSGLQAQVNEELKSRYETETIYMRDARYVKNGITHRMGFMGNKMKNEFEMSPEGLATFQKYRSQSQTGFSLAVLATAAMFGSMFLAEQNPGVGLATLGAGVVLAGVSVPFSIKAQRNFHRSIWLRNRDVLIRK